jgi:signal transduction histidine kinase
VAERDQHGRALRITGTTSDISELKESAAALEEANRELERRVEERTAALSGANRELGEALDTLRRAQGQLVEQEKMAALGGLVAGVAHEINTPVGVGVTAASHLETCTREFSARASAGRLTRGDLNEFIEVARESADLILRNLLRADKLIRSFKQVAVDQSNEERRQIDLAEYVDEILTAWQPQLRRTALRVECEIPPRLCIETYPGAVYQVISNLIQNALTHAFDDGQQAGRIRIRARPEGEQLCLDVSDDGVGMEESVRQRVFDPFFTTRRGRGGSGLGLHIVYNLVTQVLGGSIECLASPGAGVRFVIRLPWGGAGRRGDQGSSG